LLILSSHYLPSIEWFHALLTHEEVVIDVHEHFVKQTYRNRTTILAANGKLALTIPVRKTAHHIPMHEVEIENDFRWQHQHWQAILSAYSSAPYFLYYKDHFQPLYEKEFSGLLEFNQALLKVCLKLMKVEEENIPLSNTYIHAKETDTDGRLLISPKKESTFVTKSYLQVFTEKHVFQQNLSILDLLFNKGPRWPDVFLQ
jgi:hypothetical protein